MNRLLRKYNRILLAVFGVGLMIVFLMPQLPDLMAQFGGQGSQIATMGEDGEPVTREDWNLIQQQVQILQRLESELPPLPVIGSIGNDLDRYFLLVHEAGEAGLIGGDASAGINPDTLLTLARQTGFPPAAIRQTLINYSGIRRYLTMVTSSGRLSDRRLRHEARRMIDGVDTRYVVVPAEPGDTPPSAEDLQTHFDEWADVEPGEGAHGFGYRLPDRAAIEWMEIPNATIEAAVRASIAADDLPVRKYWRQHESRFETIEPGAAVPDDVTDAFVQQRLEDMRPTIARAAGDALRTPRRGFESVNNFIVLPEDWDSARVDLADLRSILAERFELPLEGDDALPQPEATSELLDLEAIGRLPRVGRAGTDRYGRAASGNTQRSLADLVGAAKEFGGIGEVPVQSGLAGPILTDRQNNIWVFRIIDTDAARPPADVDEVREDMTRDLQRLARWNAMQSELENMQTRAGGEGLDAYAASAGWTVQGPRSFQRYLHPSIPRPATIPGLGTDQELIDAIVDRSIELGTTPLADVPAEERILILPSDANMAVMIASLDGRTPLQQANYERFLDQGVLQGRVLANELGGDNADNLAASFTTDALRARHNFRRSGEDQDADEAPADASATASAE
ncbi:MAG: hypothetical protein QF733_08200 [Phycisphaerales bacterium]|jgi:hypothetical protein|nr:hypothetical protein [Phycisphaerales bacterium]